MRALFLGLAAVVVAGLQPVLAHPGGLNSAGCHTNRRTGEYHCHGGGYSGGGSGGAGGGGGGGGGGYSAPAPQPVCEDVKRTTIDITLLMADDRRKSASNVAVKKVSAKLDGVNGQLYSYTVDGLGVRNFVASDGTSKFSFGQSPWILVTKTESKGNSSTIVSTLQPNSIGVSQEEYTTIENWSKVCR